MIRKTFAHHTPTPEALEVVRRLRRAFSALHDDITSLCPDGREQACARTNLETAAMWAIKAVVVNDPASEVESD